jgi:hypothetical protein
MLAFDGPDERNSWAPHGEEAFYVGPAMNRYRCYEVHGSKTKRSRITDTLSWHPRRFTSLSPLRPLPPPWSPSFRNDSLYAPPLVAQHFTPHTAGNLHGSIDTSSLWPRTEVGPFEWAADLTRWYRTEGGFSPCGYAAPCRTHSRTCEPT